MSYPVLLGLVKIWNVFEPWVWLMAFFGGMLWVLSGLKGRKSKTEAVLVNGVVRPVREDLAEALRAAKTATSGSEPVQAEPHATPAPAKPATPGPVAPAKRRGVKNPPAPASDIKD